MRRGLSRGRPRSTNNQNDCSLYSPWLSRHLPLLRHINHTLCLINPVKINTCDIYSSHLIGAMCSPSSHSNRAVGYSGFPSKCGPSETNSAINPTLSWWPDISPSCSIPWLYPNFWRFRLTDIIFNFVSNESILAGSSDRNLYGSLIWLKTWGDIVGLLPGSYLTSFYVVSSGLTEGHVPTYILPSHCTFYTHLYVEIFPDSADGSVMFITNFDSDCKVLVGPDC